MIEIIESNVYSRWLLANDAITRGRIRKRLERVEKGNFGDYKPLGNGLYELRFYFGGGIRVYYTLAGERVVLLLAGGNKSTQSKDIATARSMIKDIGGRK